MVTVLFGTARPAFACDPLGCLLAGQQDVLAIVTVTAVTGKEATVLSDYYYDLSLKKPNGPLRVDFSKGTPWVPIVPKDGAHYFISLSCKEMACVPKWGTWEIDSVDYRQAKLLEIKNGDDAAIQWFMNGKGSDFYGIEDKMYARTASGDFEIYPKYTAPQQTEKMNTTHIFLILMAGFGIFLIRIMTRTPK